MIYTPSSLDEALDLLACGRRRPLAGATDYMAARKRGSVPPEDLVSLDSLDELKKISSFGGGLCIGSMVTFSRLEKEKRIPACLREAASLVGGPQIRNRGTLGGNIMTASPAADGVPPLAVLGAVVVLESKRGKREVPLESFMTGPGRTGIRPGELLTAVLVPPLPGISSFRKLGRRNALSISIVNIALRLFAEEGRIADIAVAVGSAGPVVTLARRTAAFLRGNVFEGPALPKTLGKAAEILGEELSPISDIRASAWYRREAAVSIFADMALSIAGGV
jgi:CO/xanthine dehydrogenase FAD-binding subunit